MSYKYNNTRIKEFAESKGIGGRTIANKMGMTNDLAPRGWIACTEKIQMHHFINFVNTFGLQYFGSGIQQETDRTVPKNVGRGSFAHHRRPPET